MAATYLVGRERAALLELSGGGAHTAPESKGWNQYNTSSYWAIQYVSKQHIGYCRYFVGQVLAIGNNYLDILGVGPTLVIQESYSVDIVRLLIVRLFENEKQ